MRFGLERAGQSAWAPETVAAVTAYRREAVPLEDWPAAALRREERVGAVLRALADLQDDSR